MNKINNFRLAVSILALFIFLAGLHLVINTRNINLKYQLTDLKVRLAESKSKTRSLGGQAAREENLADIEKTAKGKLDMIYPAKINYIVGSELYLSQISKEAIPRRSSSPARPEKKD